MFFSTLIFFPEIIFKCLFFQEVFYIDDTWTGKSRPCPYLAFITNSVTLFRLPMQ